MEKQMEKPVPTSRTSDPHRGTREESVNKTVTERHHASYGDTSGENGGFEPDGPVLLHQRDKKR